MSARCHRAGLACPTVAWLAERWGAWMGRSLLRCMTWLVFTRAAYADEGSCAPVDLERGVPALLATTRPEPDAVGAGEWVALEARFHENLACSSLLDRRDLATLYLAAANVVSLSDPGRRDDYLAAYVRLAPDAPRRFSLDPGASPIGTIPTSETQSALARAAGAADVRVTSGAQVWIDGRAVRPGDVLDLASGEHLLQQVGDAVTTRAFTFEAGQGYALARPGRGLRVGLAATGGVFVAAGVASLVWGYGHEQRIDDVDEDRDAAIRAWLGAGVGLAALGTGALVASAAWTPSGDVQVRLSGRFQ